MATVSTTPDTDSLAPPPMPRLQNGDRLTREEFERRYDADPTLKKAELIEGVVIVGSPVRQTHHSERHFDSITWLGFYKAATLGVKGGDNASLRLDLDNEPQPDAFLFILPEYGGQVKIDKDGYVVGAPELIDEVSASTVSYDLHSKLNVYRRAGVKEYVVWRVEDQAIDWFISRSGVFEPLPIVDGIYKSEAFPGLWLDAAAMIAGNMGQVLRVAQAGLESPQHREFVAMLHKKLQGTQN